MPTTQKPLSHLDYEQNIQRAYNDENATIGVDGFLTGKIGRKVELAVSATSVAGDTETYTFSENGVNLYAIKIIYTDDTRSLMVSAERIS